MAGTDFDSSIDERLAVIGAAAEDHGLDVEGDDSGGGQPTGNDPRSGRRPGRRVEPDADRAESSLRGHVDSVGWTDIDHGGGSE